MWQKNPFLKTIQYNLLTLTLKVGNLQIWIFGIQYNATLFDKIHGKKIELHCSVFEKKKSKNCIVLYCFCQIVLYCIPKNQISRFPTYRVKAKKLYCIVFIKNFCYENFLPQIFLPWILSNSVALYCIPKNQISRFPTYRVKAKRLYCIVMYCIIFKKMINWKLLFKKNVGLCCIVSYLKNQIG